MQVDNVVGGAAVGAAAVLGEVVRDKLGEEVRLLFMHFIEQ